MYQKKVLSLFSLSFLFFLTPISLFGQSICAQHYSYNSLNQNADLFINLQPVKEILISSGIAKNDGLIQAEIVESSQELGKNSNTGFNPTEIKISVSYLDQKGNSKKKSLLAKTKNYIGPKSKWDFSILDTKVVTPEDVYLEILFGWRSNDVLRIITGVRFEMEEAQRQLFSSQSLIKDKAELDLFSLFFQLKQLRVSSENETLYSDMADFLSKWNKFKRSIFQGKSSVNLSIDVIANSFKSRNLKDQNGNEIASLNSENIKLWLKSNSDFLNFELPLLGVGSFKKESNMVEFEFNGIIDKLLSLKSIEEKLKNFGLFEFSTLNIKTTHGELARKIHLKISNISLLRENELKNLINLFSEMESFFDKELSHIYSFNIERSKVLEYMKKKLRKIKPRVNNLEKKEEFVRKTYKDYFRRQTKPLTRFEWLIEKEAISESAAIEYIFSLFPDLSEADQHTLRDRKNRFTTDYIDSLEF